MILSTWGVAPSRNLTCHHWV